MSEIRIPITRPTLPPLEDYTALLADIWESRMLSNFGTFAQQLEALTANQLGVGTRVVANADIGLVLTIAALELPEGSQVLVPSFTFNSTVNAIIWNRLQPVFVDIDPTSLNMDPQAAAEAASASEPKLILATHVFGNPCDSDSLREIASKSGAFLVFDAAHAYGSQRGPKAVGGLGDAEVFSLSGTKPVTSAEGGLVASANPDLLERIDYLRAYGFQRDYNSKFIGLNGKMSELHAALGVLTLRRVKDAIDKRLRAVATYRELLSETPGIGYQTVRPQDVSTYKDFAVFFSSRDVRDEVELALSTAGIQTKRYFRPCHQMDAFRGYANRPLPRTEEMSDRVLCVPLYESMTPADVSDVSLAILTGLGV